VAATGPRRARWALCAAGAIFVGAVVVSVLTAASAAPLLRALFDAGRPVLSEAMASARGEQQEEFVRQFDGTREALASAGWAPGPADAAPRFECWVEEDESVCGLFAHTELSTSVPAATAQQPAAVDRMFAATTSTLAGDGWECSGPLARAPDSTATATCTSGSTKLDVACRAPALGAAPRLTMELHLSREAYRSDGDGESV
jgi:hypothetical protein